jgi:hypothetical protein
LKVLQKLFRLGMRHGWSKGVVEGSPAWLTVGGLALLGYLVGKVMHREPEVVFSEKLRPGQSLRITHEAAP